METLFIYTMIIIINIEIFILYYELFTVYSVSDIIYLRINLQYMFFLLSITMYLLLQCNIYCNVIYILYISAKSENLTEIIVEALSEEGKEKEKREYCIK